MPLLLPAHAQSRYFITQVYLWSNGTVATYDQYGQQMPEYQGPYEDVVDKINAVYDGVWNKRTVGVLSYGIGGES